LKSDAEEAARDLARPRDPSRATFRARVDPLRGQDAPRAHVSLHSTSHSSKFRSILRPVVCSQLRCASEFGGGGMKFYRQHSNVGEKREGMTKCAESAREGAAIGYSRSRGKEKCSSVLYFPQSGVN